VSSRIHSFLCLLRARAHAGLGIHRTRQAYQLPLPTSTIQMPMMMMMALAITIRTWFLRWPFFLLPVSPLKIVSSTLVTSTQSRNPLTTDPEFLSCSNQLQPRIYRGVDRRMSPRAHAGSAGYQLTLRYVAAVGRARPRSCFVHNDGSLRIRTTILDGIGLAGAVRGKGVLHDTAGVVSCFARAADGNARVM